MDNIKLTAKLRDVEKDKLLEIRDNGLVPAVIYGAGEENQHLTVLKNELIKIYRKTGGNTIVELDIDGAKKENVLIYQVEYHPVTGEINHVDFIRVKMDVEITAKIPLEYVGISKAVKENGGTFIANMDELEVTCLPAKLPKQIEVDISKLVTFDDAIHINDLVLPEGVKIDREPDEVLATVIPPRSEEELAELDKEVEEDTEKVEVEEKGKKDEEEDGDSKEEGKPDKKEAGKEDSKK